MADKSIRKKLEDENEVEVPEDMYDDIVKIDDAIMEMEEGLDEIREVIQKLLWQNVKYKKALGKILDSIEQLQQE